MKLTNTAVAAFVLLIVIGMMIIPVPSWIIDFGLAASFAVSILVFTLVLFVQRPLDFSSFPTVLLVCLMLRLALNVASTKLIIGEGHTGVGAAGSVIESFASFVMGGSLFLGIIIFLIFLIVNFLVINKGAARMAEVSARFALDGMPGKQLAIDSDMSSGAISFEEAKIRRKNEQDETAFFGSLDGASKFVKGDAVAGLLITLLNLVAGCALGILAYDLTIFGAFETYAILTVGDGIVSQIPAVIISISSAILLSRGGLRETADVAIADQFSRYPWAIIVSAVFLAILAILPGLPFLPFFSGFLLLLVTSYFFYSSGTAETTESVTDRSDHDKPAVGIADVLELETLHIEFSPSLVNMILDDGTGLDARVVNLRRHIASSFGVILPEVRLTDEVTLTEGQYVFRIQGVEVDKGTLIVGSCLVLAQSSLSEAS